MIHPDVIQLDLAAKAARALYANAPIDLQSVGACSAAAVLRQARDIGTPLPAGDVVHAIALALGFASLAIVDLPQWEVINRRLKRFKAEVQSRLP